MLRRPSPTAQLLLALAALALAIAPLRGLGKAHCQHSGGIGAVGEHPTAHQHAPPAASTEDSPADGECPHCPIQQCASQVACSVQLADATGQTRAHRPSHHAANQVPALLVAPILRSLAPPTPPPQLDA